MQRKQNCFPDLEFLSKVSVFLSCLCGLNQFLWLLFESNCVLGPKLLGRRLDWEAWRFQLISNRERKFKVVWHHVGLSQTFSVIIVIKHQTGFEHSCECPTVPDLTRGESSKLSDIMSDFHKVSYDHTISFNLNSEIITIVISVTLRKLREIILIVVWHHVRLSQSFIQFHSISLSLPSCPMRLALQGVKSSKSALQMVHRKSHTDLVRSESQRWNLDSHFHFKFVLVLTCLT